MNVGIDLGATNSVIAVKGSVKLVDGYPPPIYLPDCDVSIIPTPDGEAKFPSVVWVDPQAPHSILVGQEAKRKALEGEAPIMFSKRLIGTNEPLRIHDHAFTAREVATHILKHLRECAEKALGEPVHRAVVTHPAYFAPKQVQETRESAIAAGLDMARPEQMMTEPTAAVFAFTKGVEKNSLKVMTYDLGGTSFVATVLEKTDNFVSIKALDGDHFLGGCKFDHTLVQWLLNRVKEQGAKLPVDEDTAEDRERRARLLRLAEIVKIKLAGQSSSKALIDVYAPDILLDARRKPVPILEQINRQQFSELIREDLDATVNHCRAALVKAGMQAQELDALLLVGGSCYGPWVQAAIKEAFGFEGQLHHPDLCIAAGAAVCAAELPAAFNGQGIEVELDVPSSSPLPTIHVSGRLRAKDNDSVSQLMSGTLRLFLFTPTGSTVEPQFLAPEGQFLFPSVKLQEGVRNEFVLQIVDSRGVERLNKPFLVEFAPETGALCAVSSVLPQPIFVRTQNGMTLVIEEGALLPAKREMRLTKLHGDANLDIELFNGQQHVGTIDVNDLPADSTHGSDVVLTIEVTEEGQLKGHAAVNNRDGSAAAESTVEMQLLPTELPTWAELRTRYDDLESRRQELEAISDDPGQRVLLAGKGKKLSQNLQLLLAGQTPDRQAIQNTLDDLRRVVDSLSKEMDPPLAQFQHFLEDCRHILANAPGVSALELRKLLERIEVDATDAYAAKDQRRWGAANGNLHSVRRRVGQVFDDAMLRTPNGLPSATILKEMGRREVGQLRGQWQAKHDELVRTSHFREKIKPRLNRIAEAIERLSAAVDRIHDDLDPTKEFTQVQLTFQQFSELGHELDSLEIDVAATKPIMGIDLATCNTTAAVRRSEPTARPVLRRRGGTPEMPSVTVDPVHFSVTSPPSVLPGSSFDIDFWAHLGRQRQKVLQRAREEAMGAGVRIKSKGPVEVARGTILTVSLRVVDLAVDPLEDTILWKGEVGNATFALTVPDSAVEGARHGVARIRIGGLEVARLSFIVQIAQRLASTETLPMREQRHQMAFASYASADQDAVLLRIQVLRKALPGLDVFFARKDLRSGEKWKERLAQEIQSRDVMYLFWSKAASASKWVNWEWRYGLKTRGLDFIDPFPLVPPQTAPPPKELADELHFDDWELDYMNKAKKSDLSE